MYNGYSICLNKWALDKSIKNELGLLLIISSLCAEKGYCYASNDYFAKLFETNSVVISRKIKLLEEKKYIIIEYEKRGCEIKNRYIRLTNLLIDDYQKSLSTINKKVKENNISINNTSINKYNIYSLFEEIIDYLNKKTDKHFKSSTPKTRTLIKARLKENFTLEDFKKVIDTKTNEWLNDKKMNQYLRPDTLFGTKFESYLNQQQRDITTKDLAKNMDFSDVL